MCRQSRSGFSLVELIVALGILGALAGLLLPAVQKVREAANGTQCSHNLRQIGQAVHHQQDQFRYLPSLGYYDDVRGRAWTAWYVSAHKEPPIHFRPTIFFGFPAPPSYQLAGWAYQLLPYLEQESLFVGRGSVGIFESVREDKRLEDMRFGAVVRTVTAPLAVYSCPSRGGPRSHRLERDPFQPFHPQYGLTYVSCHACHDLRNPTFAVQPALSVAQTDYAANGGTGPGDVQGPFTVLHRLHYGSKGQEFGAAPHPVAKVKGLDHIKDGSSQTILFGDKGINQARMDGPQADDIYGWASSYTSSTVRWCGGPAPAPYRRPVRDFSAPEGVDAGGRFGSAHPGGARFAFADGSVRPVSYTVAGDVFARLCLAADGRPVSDDDFP
jgi:prepilin-type N-terminal cleavage/methylation domain-containing protein/prepilin-type processing-associated H-X9-DG protein